MVDTAVNTADTTRHATHDTTIAIAIAIAITIAIARSLHFAEVCCLTARLYCTTTVVYCTCTGRERVLFQRSLAIISPVCCCTRTCTHTKNALQHTRASTSYAARWCRFDDCRRVEGSYQEKMSHYATGVELLLFVVVAVLAFRSSTRMERNKGREGKGSCLRIQ